MHRLHGSRRACVEFQTEVYEEMKTSTRRMASLLRIVCFPLLVLSIPVLRLLRIRVLYNPVFPPSFSRIGHLALEIDCFVKEGMLNLRPAHRGLIVFPRDKIANAVLLEYWKKHVFVIDSPFWTQILSPWRRWPSICFRVDQYVTIAPTVHAIQAAFQDRPPLLQLTPQHRQEGAERLRELGVPPEAWYVCFHVREGGYDANDPLHTTRNADIANYVLAMKEIVARGGWCVRMGDPTMKQLPPLSGVIDYAHSPLRSDWMDIFLCASCYFFVGSASGLNVVANVFGVSSAIANASGPVLALGAGNKDLSIPKLLWSEPLGRHLTIQEITSTPMGNARFTECNQSQGIVAQENSPGDIRDLIVEMLEEKAGRFVEDDDDRKLQGTFRSLIKPGHYCFGGVSRMGRQFLRKHRNLIDPNLAPEPRFEYVRQPCRLSTCFCT